MRCASILRGAHTPLTSPTCGLLQVRQYALATALAKYGAMAGPGQIGPSVLTVDVHVGTGSELVRTQLLHRWLHYRPLHQRAPRRPKKAEGWSLRNVKRR